MKKLIIGSFSLLLASVMTAPAVRAESGTMTETGTTREQPATQIEKIRQQTNGRHYPKDTQVEQQETGTTDWEQAPTQTEQLQQQTETEDTYPTQPGQPGTETEDWQQTPTQRGTQQAGDYETEAFNLVNSAYRGELQAQGIPSYSQLVRDYGTGQVTAEDLVEAAIEADMVSPETIEDEEYLNAVRVQLDALRPTR
ncbi:hypothetical protein IQ238_23375 [Pleurocapsales cyanobacterium LEGE 06147]|nr:hypothetical protein [Pleurocapsales cyanobacterium LEGE 06147]